MSRTVNLLQAALKCAADLGGARDQLRVSLKALEDPKVTRTLQPHAIEGRRRAAREGVKAQLKDRVGDVTKLLDAALTSARTKRQVLARARFAPAARDLPPAYEGAKVIDQGAHARAERERDRLTTLNLLSQLVEDTARVRWAGELSRSTPQRLVQLAGDAAAQGDAPLLAILADEVDARGLKGVEGGQLRIAVDNALETIKLPDFDEEVAERAELLQARLRIAGAWHEIESGEQDLAGAAARIAERGGETYLAERRAQAAEEKKTAAQLAERIASEPVVPDSAA